MKTTRKTRIGAIAIAVLLLCPFAFVCTKKGRDNPLDPHGQPLSTVRVIADTTVNQPPAMDTADEQVWAGVDSFLVEMQSGIPKLMPPEASGIPINVYVQAINKAGKLYVRLQWTDITFDAYPEAFEVSDTTPPIEFSQEAGILDEDQVYVMFADAIAGGYDVWNWRVLTTGAGGLAKGYTFQDAATELTADALGSVTDSVTVKNPPHGLQPTYAHRDTSGFDYYILYTTDTVSWDSILFATVDTVTGIIDSTVYFFWNTTGWSMGQRIPGWLIDSSFASLSDAQRGSRWDIRAVSVYDDVASRYRVVLCRQLSTGYSDDIALADMDSVKVKVGIYDDQEDFRTGSSNRGYSDDFWIILK